MRIIVANYRYFIAGGPERYMFKFMEAAKERGIEIIPFSVSNSQNEKTEYSKYFAKPRTKELMYSETKKTVSNLLGMIRATTWNFDAEKRMRKLIKDTRPDAVYILHEVNHLSPSIIRAAKKEGVRVVHRISDFFMFCPKYDFLCGDEICEACLHNKYKKAIEKKCVKNSRFGTILRIIGMIIYRWTKVFDDVDSFICTCEFSKTKLIEGGVDPKRIKVIPTFIDSSKIEPSYVNGKYFLFLGRMAHQKGTMYAIQAMKYLKDTDYVLKITGELGGSTEDMRIKQYIENNNIQNKIIFTGFLKGDALDNLIKNASCIVCPAIWYENLPNTVIEAYANGKPVVATRIGSLAEIVEDGKTGFLFELKNAKDLSDRLRLFVDDEKLSEEIGRKARSICETTYAVNTHMDKVLDILLGRDGIH